MRSFSKRKGMTILELLVSMGVFALFTFMVADAMVVAYQSKNKTEDKVQARRFVSVFFARLHREMRTRDVVKGGCYPLDPEPNGSPNPFVPNSPGTTMNVTYVQPDGTFRQANYWFDSVKQAVFRTEFDPDTGVVTQPTRAIINLAKSMSITRTVAANPADSYATVAVGVSTFAAPFTTNIYYYTPVGFVDPRQMISDLGGFRNDQF